MGKIAVSCHLPYSIRVVTCCSLQVGMPQTLCILLLIWDSLVSSGSVVHFSGHQATEAAIKLTSLATFAGEQGTSSIKKFEYGCTDDQIESERAGTCSLKMPDPVWMVALRALSMVNNSDVEYNLLEKNCELFCCWC
ncbi:hypothetical protein FOZ63_007602, partial [Perkinsus olseni]